jgi:hypothetical protein
VSTALLVVGLALVVFLAVLRNQAKRSALRVQTTELRVDDLGVRRALADGREERVDWSELSEVEVLTAATGPYKVNGGVVILAGDPALAGEVGHGCLVPIDRIGPSGLVDQLVVLPGFDVNLFAEALDKKPPTRTTCWRRDS